MMSPYPFLLKAGTFFRSVLLLLPLPKAWLGCRSLNMSDGQFQKKIHNFQNIVSNGHLGEFEKGNISLKVFII